MKPWIVLNYGGTSVAGADRWKRVADRIEALRDRYRVWVVVSAPAGETDALARAVAEALAGEAPAALPRIRERQRALLDELGVGGSEAVDELLDGLDSRLREIRLAGEAPPRLRAQIMAVAELCSTRIGIHALASRGVGATWVDARGLLTGDHRTADTDEERYLAARVPVRCDPQSAERQCSGHEVVLTQGCTARTGEGHTCRLGRGGGDTSAALFAALLDADELEIWTGVHGMFTADPRRVPVARLIRRMGYREAQELAALGANVLHPRCLGPLRERGVPVSIHSIEDPRAEGTRIESTEEDHPAVTAVTCRAGVTLLSISSLSMRGEPGYLARVAAACSELGISIDLVATSQHAISLTLDRLPGGPGGPVLVELIERLEHLGRVQLLHPCAVVAIVGRRIRRALHELGPAMAVFRERPVHLVSDSAEDLNLSFVVDEADAHSLVSRLHGHLFGAQGGGPRLGPTWEMLRRDEHRRDLPARWWLGRRDALLELCRDGQARYVYHLPTVADRARELTERLGSVDRVYYAMKANPRREILRTVVERGLGLECVSLPEILRARETGGADVPLLFTPNFCPLDEYRGAFAAGAEVVIDGPEPLELAPEIFEGREIGLRIDPGRGLGHHEKVRTAGSGVKFGHPAGDVERVVHAATAAGAVVVGLHAHVGSGILEPGAWLDTGRALAALRPVFPKLRWIDVGGGLGVADSPAQEPLDLAAVETGLAALRRELGSLELRIEPGRFVVSEAGVLLLPVTQVRRKSGVNFAGVATGMNSLIRPALYGAWHAVHNLSRIEEPVADYWHVVGPICESGDVLGRDRPLPATRPGDVLLAEHAGAYGAVMASRYNLREPAAEVVLED